MFQLNPSCGVLTWPKQLLFQKTWQTTTTMASPTRNASNQGPSPMAESQLSWRVLDKPCTNHYHEQTFCFDGIRYPMVNNSAWRAYIVIMRQAVPPSVDTMHEAPSLPYGARSQTKGDKKLFRSIEIVILYQTTVGQRNGLDTITWSQQGQVLLTRLHNHVLRSVCYTEQWSYSVCI